MISQFDQGLAWGIYLKNGLDSASEVYGEMRKNGSTKGVSMLVALIGGALWPVMLVIGLFIKDDEKPSKKN